MKVVITAMAMALGVLLTAASCGGGGCPCPTATPTYPTAAPTATPTPTNSPTSTTTTTEKTPTPTYTSQLADCVEIYRIKYEGIQLHESDEYVTIRNRCDENINLQGWVLKNITNNDSPSFTFPFYVLMSHSKVEVYTDDIYPDSFRFHWPAPIWNNSAPDTAALYDAKGRLISTKSYELNE